MSRKSRKNVGVIGLGIIGTRVAAGLRAAGFQVYVWNRSARAMPNFLGSPAEVADSTEIIQCFVADAAALFDVIEAFGDALTSKHVFVCNATVGPEAVLEAAELVTARGAEFLDAPFTGSKGAAEKRQLVYYIGGSESAFQRARPILEASSKAIVHIGEIGHAATIKVVTNMISAVTVQTLAEALAIVQKAGLPAEALAAAIEQNACRSGVIDLKLGKMMAGDYEPHFSLKHMFKDVQLGIHMANALDLEIPATTVTAGVMYGALSEGCGELDYSALFKTYTRDERRQELPALNERQERAELPAPAARAPEKDVTPAPTAASTAIPAERDIQPTEAAAKMIEAVLAQASSGWSEAPATTEAATTASAPSANLAEEKPSAEPGKKTMLESSAVVDPQPASRAVENASGETETTALTNGETVVHPINYVRRWFVARMGG